MGTITAGDRVMFQAISNGLGEYLEKMDRYNGPMEKVRRISQNMAEARKRVDFLLEQDRANRENEDRRSVAQAMLECGDDSLVADTVIIPTPELLRTGDFIPYTPGRKNWTDRDVKTVRRLNISQITYLLSRGTLDDQLYSACKWYQERYEASQLAPKSAVANYGETVRGDPVYGHLPSSEWAAEARADFRWARRFINLEDLKYFEMVVLEDVPLTHAAKQAKCRYTNIRAAFRKACFDLYDGISARLNAQRLS